MGTWLSDYKASKLERKQLNLAQPELARETSPLARDKSSLVSKSRRESTASAAGFDSEPRMELGGHFCGEPMRAVVRIIFRYGNTSGAATLDSDVAQPQYTYNSDRYFL